MLEPQTRPRVGSYGSAQRQQVHERIEKNRRKSFVDKKRRSSKRRKDADTELPVLGTLDGIGNISIVISDWKQAAFAKEFYSATCDTKFPLIQFLIWQDEFMTLSKENVLLLAEIKAGHGFAVRNCFDEEELFLVQPVHDSLYVFGSIKTPNGKMLYQFDRPANGIYHIQSVGHKSAGSYAVQTVNTLCMAAARTLGFVSDERKFQLVNDGLTVAIIRQAPSLRQKKAYFIQFRDKDSADSEMKCLALGFALLMTLTEVYSDLSELLKQSMKQRRRQSSSFFGVN